MAENNSKIKSSLRRTPKKLPFKSRFKRSESKTSPKNYEPVHVEELLNLTLKNSPFGDNVFDTVRELAKTDNIDPADVGNLSWYFATVYKFYNFGNFQRERQITTSNRTRSNVQEPFNGRMVIFKYQPQDRSKVHDVFPLVITLQRDNDSFLGCNLHYHHPVQRAILFERFMKYTLSGRDLSRYSTRFRTNMDLVKRFPRLYDLVQPCIRRYKYSNMASRFLLVPPMDWGTALFLPFELFKNQNRMAVYKETLFRSNEVYGI
jgi:hypothetical protein